MDGKIMKIGEKQKETKAWHALLITLSPQLFLRFIPGEALKLKSSTALVLFVGFFFLFLFKTTKHNYY